MSVYIECDKCQKRLKIPENVVGRSIKCPSCGAVFKADPAKSAPQPVAAALGDEDVVPTRKKAVTLEDEDEATPAARKKAVLKEDDDDLIQPAPKKAVVEEDDDRPVRSKKRYADEDEETPKKGRRGTPWYVLLPLLLLSFTGAGLAWLWALGFSYLDIDRGVSLSFDSRMWIGIGAATHVTLFCLIFSLMPARAWVRFLLVLLVLGLGFGESFALMYWWKETPFKAEEKSPDAPGGGALPGMGPMPMGGAGRGGAPGRGGARGGGDRGGRGQAQPDF